MMMEGLTLRLTIQWEPFAQVGTSQVELTLDSMRSRIFSMKSSCAKVSQ